MPNLSGKVDKRRRRKVLTSQPISPPRKRHLGGRLFGRGRLWTALPLYGMNVRYVETVDVIRRDDRPAYVSDKRCQRLSSKKDPSISVKGRKQPVEFRLTVEWQFKLGPRGHPLWAKNHYHQFKCKQHQVKKLVQYRSVYNCLNPNVAWLGKTRRNACTVVVKDRHEKHAGQHIRTQIHYLLRYGASYHSRDNLFLLDDDDSCCAIEGYTAIINIEVTTKRYETAERTTNKRALCFEIPSLNPWKCSTLFVARYRCNWFAHVYFGLLSEHPVGGLATLSAFAISWALRFTYFYVCPCCPCCQVVEYSCIGMT